MITDPATWLEAVLAGDKQATRLFIVALRPVVHARVARSLIRFRGRARGGDVGQEVDDFAQEVFVALLKNDKRVLRRWRADGGLNLKNFVALVAHRLVTNALFSRNKNPWADEPTESRTLENQLGGVSGLARVTEQRDLLRRVLEQMSAELSPEGRELFQLLQVERRPIEEVMELTGKKRNAVYAWRSRLARRARAIATSLMSDPPADQQTQKGDGS